MNSKIGALIDSKLLNKQTYLTMQTVLNLNV